MASSATVDSSSTNVQVVLCATLEGHKGPVTAIAAPSDATKKFIVSGSRGMPPFPPSPDTLDGWMGGSQVDTVTPEDPIHPSSAPPGSPLHPSPPILMHL